MAHILGTTYDLSTTTLDLSNRNITSEMLPDLFVIISKLSNLTELLFDDNQITTIPKNIFNKLTKLTHLSLYNNQISIDDMSDHIFDAIGTSLTHLDLSCNQRSTNRIPVFYKLKNLEYLSF
jgi:Leucine-rich repeat (LRR) protein